MLRPPFAARVMAGIIVIAVEETRKLPTTALTLPMTAVSSGLQFAMRTQQNIAALAIKGDAALDTFFHHDEEQPSWATFDEDELATDHAQPSNESDENVTDDDALDEAPTAKGRFALYSSPPETVASAVATQPTTNASDGIPDIVELLDYDGLTLAQLRSKIRGIDVSELAALVAYEQTQRSRAPFITMLENRISAASAT